MQIVVIGAGQMGLGIVEVFKRVSIPCKVFDVNPKAVERARSLGVQAEVFNPEVTLGNTELIIEAIAENFQLKAKLWQSIASQITENMLVASNTSSISITWLASQVPYPEKFLGIHFMNPAPKISLVEIIPGMQTSVDTLGQAQKLMSQIGQEPIIVQDHPGFVVNKILIPMINEAISLLDNRTAGIEDIDKAMRLGAKHPIGPLALADLIGLDTVLAIMQILQQNYGDKYRPSLMLIKNVQAGYLGRKTGRGFYIYTKS